MVPRLLLPFKPRHYKNVGKAAGNSQLTGLEVPPQQRVPLTPVLLCTASAKGRAAGCQVPPHWTWGPSTAVSAFLTALRQLNFTLSGHCGATCDDRRLGTGFHPPTCSRDEGGAPSPTKLGSLPGGAGPQSALPRFALCLFLMLVPLSHAPSLLLARPRFCMYIQIVLSTIGLDIAFGLLTF